MEKGIKRKDFLKHACTVGLCGCMGMLLHSSSSASTDSNANEKDSKSDWRIDFMQSRFKNLIEILNNDLDEKTLIPILNQLGSRCGEDFANKYRNNPDGFFTFIKNLWVESVTIDEVKGEIRVNEKTRDNCNCPFINKKEAPDILCNCSIGTQKRIYESLYARPVDVTLVSSVLKGDERCSFTIKLGSSEFSLQ
jgi:predicted hydrocarbon binding protein